MIINISFKKSTEWMLRCKKLAGWIFDFISFYSITRPAQTRQRLYQFTMCFVFSHKSN